jgi:lipopolysaccharide transport system ATP-binding protein
MSSDTVIKVQNLSKQFRIGTRPKGYKTFREAIVDTVKSPFHLVHSLLSAPGSLLSPVHDTIWALSGVSFEVKRGEVIGIIGRNGAGKSTLLKILSRITEPTKGKVEMKGRIGSLLEVGTGFHPELTGHENIYLYGAILGMDRHEVTRKFDKIVAFSELEKFIDTPVKRYSSGMYMRLAFAVAAHLEPEILLVDEVLAVGDVAFQKKCLGLMSDVTNEGRTVLFVSHNLGAISALCKKSLLLQSGKLVFEGSTSMAISQYTEMALNTSDEWVSGESELNEGVFLKAVRVKDEYGNIRSEFTNKEDIIIEFEVKLAEFSPELKIGFELEGESGDLVFLSFHNDINSLLRKDSFAKGTYYFKATLPNRLLNSKVYFISPRIGLHRKKWLFRYEKVVKFNVQFQIDNSNFFVAKRPGVIGPLIKWHVCKQS